MKKKKYDEFQYYEMSDEEKSQLRHQEHMKEMRMSEQRRKNANEILDFFRDTAKNEADFWLRFCCLKIDDYKFLYDFYKCTSKYGLFCKITKFWNVKIYDRS